MSTMKIARFPSKGAQVEVTTQPIPTPGPGQVRMKVHACGVCHSDIFTKYGAYGNDFPRAPGHEATGVVDAIGDGVKGFKKGDRIGLGWFGGCCGLCATCKEGDWVCCEKGQVSGIHFDGGYAEYTVAPEIAFAHLPEGLSFEEAGPLMCAGVTVFNAMRNQGVKPGQLVAIQGVGGLGHLAIQYANKMGFNVVALSTGDDKATLAKQLGAHHYINVKNSTSEGVEELKKLGGAKMIVATAPHAKSIESIVHGLATGGKLVIIAAPTENLSISPIELLAGKKSVVGWASGDARDSEDTMNFSVLAGIKPQIEIFPLEKAQEAIDHMLSNKARFRCVLKIV